LKGDSLGDSLFYILSAAGSRKMKRPRLSMMHIPEFYMNTMPVKSFKRLGLDLVR
jgi:hypothetical protein